MKRNWALLLNILLFRHTESVSTDEEFFKKASEFSEYSIKVCSVTKSSPNSLQPNRLSPPGSSDHETFQARIWKCVAISSSRASSPQIDRTCLSPALQAGSLPLWPPGKMYQLKISHSKAKMELSPQWAKLEATGYVNRIRNSEHHSLCIPGPPHFTTSSLEVIYRRKTEDFNPFSFKHCSLYLNLLHSHHPPNFFQQTVKV